MYAVIQQILQVIVSPTVDTDGDGFDDEIDAFPFDPNEWTDTDDDGIGNNSDDDDDNDGFSDELEDDVGTNSLDEDDFPIDTDLDLVIDYFDDDDDNDGQSDENEIIVEQIHLIIRKYRLIQIVTVFQIV